MTEPPAAPRRRSALVAAVLSGLGLGAGHVYVEQSRRGALLVALCLAATFAWTTQVARSYSAARLWAFPWLILVLAIIVDSARLARRAPPPARRPRWWVIVVIVLVMQVAAPLATQAALEAQVGLVTPQDDAMEPALERDATYVHDRRAEPLEPGDVVVVEDARGRVVRRVVGLPGHRVAVRGGRVMIDGAPWLRDPARLTGGGSLHVEEALVGPDEVLVLPDRRDAPGAESWRVPRDTVRGRVTWLLRPPGLDLVRVGEPVR